MQNEMSAYKKIYRLKNLGKKHKKELSEITGAFAENLRLLMGW